MLLTARRKAVPAILLGCMFFFAYATGFAQKKKPANKSANSKKMKPPGAPVNNTSDDAIKNGIQFTSNGFMVAEAYLMFDDENPVPPGNKVSLNQNVNLLLIVDSGWNEIGGRVYPGSKQVVKLSNGEEILDTEDIFLAFDETGVASNDARYITLNTVVPEIKDKRKPVVVNFRVWDKKGTGEIKGSYKLFVK